MSLRGITLHVPAEELVPQKFSTSTNYGSYRSRDYYLHPLSNEKKKPLLASDSSETVLQSRRELASQSLKIKIRNCVVFRLVVYFFLLLLRTQ